MKRLLTILALFTFTAPVFADVTPQEDQKVENSNSFLGVNLLKQPEEQGGKQLVTNKKSFLFINIVINGKPVEVKDKQTQVK